MPLCFAIMPISMPPELLERYDNEPMHFLHVAEHIFRPAAEEAGFEFRSPSTTSAEIIQAEIIGNLAKADLVLCDISTWNPNVFFELGIRVALDKPVAMVRDHHTDRIPFDNSMINTHRYDGCQVASGGHLIVAIFLVRGVLGSRKEWLTNRIKLIARDNGYDGEHTSVEFHAVRKRHAP